MSTGRPSYLAAAFNARPLGMPIPPNWIYLAAIGMLGAFLHPGWWLIGAGLEIGYLAALVRSVRFRKAVDAGNRRAVPDRRAALLAELGDEDRRIQEALEGRCDEILKQLRRLDADHSGAQADQLAQLCWLHLRLLVSRHALAQVVAGGSGAGLERRSRELKRRLEKDDLDPAIRESLEGQMAVLADRAQGHARAATRLQVMEAEVVRIREQIELAREQALLATDANGLTRSVDALADSLGRTNAWMQEQRDLFTDIDPFANAPTPSQIFATARSKENA